MREIVEYYFDLSNVFIVLFNLINFFFQHFKYTMDYKQIHMFRMFFPSLSFT